MSCTPCQHAVGKPGLGSATQQVSQMPVTTAAKQYVCYPPSTKAAKQEVTQTPVAEAIPQHFYPPCTTLDRLCNPCNPDGIAPPPQVSYTPTFREAIAAYRGLVPGPAPPREDCGPKAEDPCRRLPKSTFVPPENPYCRKAVPKESGLATGRTEPSLDTCRLDYDPCVEKRMWQHPCLVVPPYDPYAPPALGTTYVGIVPRDVCPAQPKVTSGCYDPCAPPPKTTSAYPTFTPTTLTTYGASYNMGGLGTKNQLAYDPCANYLMTSTTLPVNQNFGTPGSKPRVDPCVTNEVHMLQGYVDPTDKCYQPVDDPCRCTCTKI